MNIKVIKRGVLFACSWRRSVGRWSDVSVLY